MADLVTIAIPAYKGDYLSEAIASALRQDYPEIELIVVNDHSPENLKQIVESFHDSRIRYYENEENLGHSSIAHNWNKCLEFARGEWFVMLCDDDMLDVDFVSRLMALSLSYPSCSVFRARTRLVDADSGDVFGEMPAWPVYEDYFSFAAATVEGNRHHTISEFLLKRATIKDKGGYLAFPSGYYSDFASILRFAEDGGVCSTEDCLVTFRKSSKNISSRNDYNVQKSLAALAFYNWLEGRFRSSSFSRRIHEKLDFDLASYYRSAGIKDALTILMKVPLRVWGFRTKLSLMKERLFKFK